MDNLKQKDIKEIFFNRADIENSEKIACDNCFEHVVFMLHDKNHEFSIGLSTVLECVAFAIKNGDLPKLPSSWVANVNSIYNYVGFLEGEDISYSDQSLKKQK